MAPRITPNTIQLGIRLEHELVARIDALAARLAPPGLTVTRSDIVRLALLEGLPKIEKNVTKRKRS